VPRIFQEGTSYDAVSSTTFREIEYQQLLLQHATSLFPDLIFIPFHKVVYADGVGSAADFAAIDPQFRRWWVIEAELAHHSLENHVLPQVSTLANAHYGAPEAQWIAQRNPHLDGEALEHLMLGEQPRVMVIVNRAQPDWIAQLRPWAEVMVVEVFRSHNDRLILRQNGAEPDVPRDVLSRCRIDPAMPRLLIVESPAPLLALSDDQILRLDYEGELTEWNLLTTADKVWLSPSRSSIFPTERFLDLVRLPENRLGLIRISS
jgi:hypothetical protein